MKIHVISTVNGQQNEGMRNIATHISRCFEEGNEVVYSSLHDLIQMPFRCMKSNVTMIFARCTPVVYNVAKICSLFSKKLVMVIVQKPQDEFLKKNNACPINCDWLTICEKDAEGIVLCKGKKIMIFEAGINAKKFSPVSKNMAESLKEEYGFDKTKPLVVHVGHCSRGRGLEDFCHIDGAHFSRLVVASGMFESADTVSALENAGVKIMSGYIENVNEIYQMADVYLFPTQDSDFVISVPLSVMEALSCGTPVLCYESFDKIKSIKTTDQKALTFVQNKEQIQAAVLKAAQYKTDNSWLLSPKSWGEVADQIYKML